MKEAARQLRTLGLLCCLTIAFTATAMAQQYATKNEKPSTAKEALGRFEQLMAEAEKDSTKEYNKIYLMTMAAPTAFEAGETEKARAYSQELLDYSAKAQKDWNTGNQIHVGNLVLGRIALAAGDVEKAKQYLLEAGKTPGSPQLDSFGPNMLLAKDLLAKSERDTVIAYFDLCAKFWEDGRDHLTTWKAQVRKGETPVFGANLNYQLSVWRFANWDNLQR
ncbi:MAG TPA: hypothetical protein VGC91_08435 [Pyrinomonadaceae bacterium]|jgi:hypothetical protein